MTEDEYCVYWRNVVSKWPKLKVGGDRTGLNQPRATAIVYINEYAWHKNSTQYTLGGCLPYTGPTTTPAQAYNNINSDDT